MKTIKNPDVKEYCSLRGLVEPSAGKCTIDFCLRCKKLANSKTIENNRIYPFTTLNLLP